MNQAFLNDLQQAMNQKVRNQPGNSQKFPSEDDSSSLNTSDRPFPNRFSSGEYENVQHSVNNSQVKKSAPPLPKRNGETHLTWDRT